MCAPNVRAHMATPDAMEIDTDSNAGANPHNVGDNGAYFGQHHVGGGLSDESPEVAPHIEPGLQEGDCAQAHRPGVGVGVGAEQTSLHAPFPAVAPQSRPPSPTSAATGGPPTVPGPFPAYKGSVPDPRRGRGNGGQKYATPPNAVTVTFIQSRWVLIGAVVLAYFQIIVTFKSMWPSQRWDLLCKAGPGFTASAVSLHCWAATCVCFMLNKGGYIRAGVGTTTIFSVLISVACAAAERSFRTSACMSVAAIILSGLVTGVMTVCAYVFAARVHSKTE